MFVIAHAGGGLDGKTYLNSKEAFFVHYRQGTRTFEFDIMLTKDNEVIATHEFEEYDWDEKHRKTLAEYKGKHSRLLTIDDILQLATIYRDVTILLDTKEDDVKTIDIYVNICDKIETLDPELYSRVIPQIYNEATYKHVETHCHFDQYIFATYKTKMGRKDIQEVVNKYPKIKGITVPGNKFKSFMIALFKGKKQVYVYTINSRFLRFISRFFRFDGVYSDYLGK